MDRFLQTLLDALAVGSLYALIALGYTMVYGILKFINFAHSDIFVLGAWVSFSAAACVGFVDTNTAEAGLQMARVAPWVYWVLGTVATAAAVMGLYEKVLRPRIAGLGGLPPTDVSKTLAFVSIWGGVALALVFVARLLVGAGETGRVMAGGVILIAAMATCGLVGFCLERMAYKPLRKAPRLNVLITAIGVSLLLQNIGQTDWMFGTRPQGMPKLLSTLEPSDGKPPLPLFSIGEVKVWLVDVMAGVTAIALMVGLDILVFRTKLGRAMRAVSFSERNAALMGIPVDRVISFTFVLGASLAAAAGFLYSQKYAGLNQTGAAGWVLLGLKAFVAAVVGGIGNIRGAMLGGLLIAALEFFGAQYISTELRDVYVFAALIVVLLFRPSGILGKSVIEKV